MSKFNVKFKTGGPITKEWASLYIERDADRLVRDFLTRMEYVLLIEPRQQGKTSLINALSRQSNISNSVLVCIDLTTLDKSSEQGWYYTFHQQTTRQLYNSIPVKQLNTTPTSSTSWYESLFEISILAQEAEKYIIFALDEIGSVSFPESIAFFRIMRSVISTRDFTPSFNHITFLMAGTFRPKNLVDDINSPFNIAQRVRINDFNINQVRRLITQVLEGYTPNEEIIKHILHWTEGQPYLVQLLGSYLQYQQTDWNIDETIAKLQREELNHIPPLVARINTNQRLHHFLGRLFAGDKIKFDPVNNDSVANLELLGLIKVDKAGFCRIRNPIYQAIFADMFMDQHHRDSTASKNIHPDSEKENNSLSKSLATRKHHLQLLKERLAQRGTLAETDLVHRIAAEKSAIAKIEAELHAITTDLDRLD